MRIIKPSAKHCQIYYNYVEEKPRKMNC